MISFSPHISTYKSLAFYLLNAQSAIHTFLPGADRYFFGKRKTKNIWWMEGQNQSIENLSCTKSVDYSSQGKTKRLCSQVQDSFNQFCMQGVCVCVCVCICVCVHLCVCVHVCVCVCVAMQNSIQRDGGKSDSYIDFLDT